MRKATNAACLKKARNASCGFGSVSSKAGNSATTSARLSRIGRRTRRPPAPPARVGDLVTTPGAHYTATNLITADLHPHSILTTGQQLTHFGLLPSPKVCSAPDMLSSVGVPGESLPPRCVTRELLRRRAEHNGGLVATLEASSRACARRERSEHGAGGCAARTAPGGSGAAAGDGVQPAPHSVLAEQRAGAHRRGEERRTHGRALTRRRAPGEAEAAGVCQPRSE